MLLTGSDTTEAMAVWDALEKSDGQLAELDALRKRSISGREYVYWQSADGPVALRIPFETIVAEVRSQQGADERWLAAHGFDRRRRS